VPKRQPQNGRDGGWVKSIPEIRESVRGIGSDFPGIYWRQLEDKQADPTEFVAALTKAGLVGSLIPEQ